MKQNVHDKTQLINLQPVRWKKSREEVWSELEKRLEGAPPGRSVTLKWWLPVAAVFMLLLASGVFMRYYSKTVTTRSGEYLTHQLPDGSTVELNADTRLRYQPLWWSFNRSLSLSGEAFFMVQPGKQFTVLSDYAQTAVLGTSFSVYARNQNYRVICHTGKVEVVHRAVQQNTRLVPGQAVELKPDGQLSRQDKPDLLDPIPWKTGLFEFTGRPLNEVLEEISRQYGVSVHSHLKKMYYYTGQFQLSDPIAITLNLVCRPFGLTFVRDENGVYHIRDHASG